MDAWTYQGIELYPGEEPAALLARICRLEERLGLTAKFQAVGTFRAPMSKSQPPRFSPTGGVRQFLHVTWQDQSALAWSVILHVAERDRRAVLSSFTGAGFLARDVDCRDGHPRESVLLAAFTSDAEDFPQPLAHYPAVSSPDGPQAWRASVEGNVCQLTGEGADSKRLAIASRLAEAHAVRYEHGWYLNSELWRSRYLVQAEDGFIALASPQEPLCTCASRHPETLQLMMPSDSCVHHLAAKLVDRIAELALQPSVLTR